MKNKKSKEHGIEELLNIGSIIGAIGAAFIAYLIAPNATISNFLWIVILVAGGIIGGLIYSVISKGLE